MLIEKNKKLANDVYNLGLNERTRKKFNICDFKELEKAYLKFLNKK